VRWKFPLCVPERSLYVYLNVPFMCTWTFPVCVPERSLYVYLNVPWMGTWTFCWMRCLVPLDDGYVVSVVGSCRT
jgi:hypothetical protein